MSNAITHFRTGHYKHKNFNSILFTYILEIPYIIFFEKLPMLLKNDKCVTDLSVTHSLDSTYSIQRHSFRSPTDSFLLPE